MDYQQQEDAAAVLRRLEEFSNLRVNDTKWRPNLWFLDDRMLTFILELEKNNIKEKLLAIAIEMSMY